ncbi:MAG: ABC transporter ATP-binding protein [Bacillota bacterium]|nr:ABC transporter ATP-binding protein [Bacillota bacterium]
MENILTVNNLTRHYSDFTLDNVSFSLPKGSIMGLIGANGAGKTTTLKLLLNLIQRDSGTISIFGKDNIKDEKEIKEQIGVVFDECYFHDNLNAADISKIMSKIYASWSKSLFSSYLSKFSLPKDKIMKQYSRGMKMKMSIAVALAHNPKLLILDEPTSGLDPVVRNEILDIFLEFIQAEDHSILLSSHITSDLEKVADYITFIRDGKIILSDEKDILLDNYGLIKCGQEPFSKISKDDIAGMRHNSFGYEILVRNKKDAARKYPGYVIDNITTEEILLLMEKENVQ